jgi:hypothetical protein
VASAAAVTAASAVTGGWVRRHHAVLLFPQQIESPTAGSHGPGAGLFMGPASVPICCRSLLEAPRFSGSVTIGSPLAARSRIRFPFPTRRATVMRKLFLAGFAVGSLIMPAMAADMTPY